MTPPFRAPAVEYRRPHDTPDLAGVLARVRFGADAAAADPREVHPGLQVLAGAGLEEVWTVEDDVRCGHDGAIAYSHAGGILFGQLRIEEAALADMEHAAYAAYRDIAGFLERSGYPHMLRCWNYFHDIHRGDGDHERYRRFVAGRYRAIAGQPGFEHNLPAATAIGTAAPGMLIYFFAGTAPGRQVENPRQLSAFRYPPQYGPRSPSFSRASLVGGQLWVSGTASIVGHETRHAGDAAAQLREIVHNLDTLLHAAAQQSGSRAGRWQPAALKLYVRDAGTHARVAPLLKEILGAGTPLLCLLGDVCRRDLLVEIEGVYRDVLFTPG